MGLVLLSLMLTGATGSASGGGQTFPHDSSSVPVWSLGGSDGDQSGLPPQANSAREHHVLSLWPPLRGERQSEHAHPALPAAPGSDADAFRDPQQLGHRTAGSRSPPLA